MIVLLAKPESETSNLELAAVTVEPDSVTSIVISAVPTPPSSVGLTTATGGISFEGKRTAEKVRISALAVRVIYDATAANVIKVTRTAKLVLFVISLWPPCLLRRVPDGGPGSKRKDNSIKPR
jgi:hypothetical protein